MISPSLLQFGTQFLGNLASIRLARATGKAADKVAAGRAEAANIAREGANELAAAQGSLARTVQSISNRRTLRYGGEVMEALYSQAAAVTDAAARGGLERGLRNSEAMGSIAARAASAGVGGNAVDALRETVGRQQVRAEQEAGGALERTQSALFTQRGRAARDTIESLNGDVILDRLDYTVNTPGVSSVGGGGGTFEQLIKALSMTGTKGLANGLTPAAEPARQSFTVKSGPLGSGTYGLGDDFLSIK